MATLDPEFRPLTDNLVEIEAIPPTDFSVFVTDILARESSSSPQTIDQNVLCQCINLASSFLLTDAVTNPEGGISTWSTGLNHLVDIVVALHNRNELELDTVNAASKACSECWTIAGNWRGLDECRQRVREVGGKLKKILDPNERTYGGERVYAP